MKRDDSMGRITARMATLLIAAAVSITVLGLGAAPASAAVSTSYDGWGTVTPDRGGSYIDAWRSTSTGWKWSYRYAGTRVYIYHWGSGWVWTWTSTTGWLAMRATDATAERAETGARGSVRTGGYGCGQPPPDGQTCGSSSTPFRNGHVTFQQGDMLIDTVTDADGNYSIRLAPGYYTARFGGWESMNGYIIVPASGYVTANLAWSLAVPQAR